MDAAFLLIATPPGSTPSPTQLALLARTDPPDLGFRADHHLRWSDAAGGVALAVWERRGNGHGRTYLDEDGLALVVGIVRRRGVPWSAEGEWARELALAARASSLAALADELRGVFTVVVASPDGTATVLGDPFGHRCTYVGETDDAFVVSSRAALAAAAIAGAGAPPLDAWSACWPAYAGYMVGDRTGYDGVRLLPPGGRVEVRPRAGAAIQVPDAPWAPDARQRALPDDELVEQVRADIADSLRASLTYPSARHVLGLTGGKDSRLILAVMIGEGIAGDYEFVTIGPPSLGDVQIASRLAARFGLRHRVELPRAEVPRDYQTVAREFVAGTAGLVNVIDLHAGLPEGDEVRVTGLGGEILRNFRALPDRLRGPDFVRRFARFNGYGRLGVVRPDAAAEYRAALTAEVLADPAGATDPIDLLGSFFLRNRVRSARIGPSEEVVSHRRVFPLSSTSAVRAARAIRPEVRQAELVHYEAIRRSCPALVDEPFAGRRWPDALRAFTDGRVPAPLATSADHEPFVARVTRRQFERRGPVLRAIFEERDNPAWSVIDPAVAVAALERFAELNGPERRQLFGAATAAVWLGR